jgi:hypothetical protein
MKITRLSFFAIIFALILGCPCVSFAAISADEAKKLGTTLTEVGAEKAGSADGSIPAYTGGLSEKPANFDLNSGKRPDPFADEKPLFSIDAKNMGQYADKLTDGTKALMQKNPTFRVDVYKTHRTVKYPTYVLEHTAKNALTAKTANNGLTLEGAVAGYPFPIPKDGYEVMWNHLCNFEGEAYNGSVWTYNMDASGHKVLATQQDNKTEYPYYNQKNPSTEIYFEVKMRYTGPPRHNGEGIMGKDALNPFQKDRQAWQYLPGQRRVKLAPTLAFDTPNSSTEGKTTYDDAYIFNGSMERYDFKLIGKKEMFVPYNTYKAVYWSTSDELCGPKIANPDDLRWELHRVWVVEATLKPGKRHVYSKRTFYIDEDSWTGLASDSYDSKGQLYRTTYDMFTFSYDVGAGFNGSIIAYDLSAGSYSIGPIIGEKGGYLKYVPPFAATEWNAESLAGQGIQ